MKTKDFFTFTDCYNSDYSIKDNIKAYFEQDNSKYTKILHALKADILNLELKKSIDEFDCGRKYLCPSDIKKITNKTSNDILELCKHEIYPVLQGKVDFNTLHNMCIELANAELEYFIENLDIEDFLPEEDLVRLKD